LSGPVIRGSFLQLLLEHCDFLNTDISQPWRLATYLRCGGIFKYDFVANLPLSLPVKECWKSVNLWGSYGQEFSVLFFTHSVLCLWVKMYGLLLDFLLNFRNHFCTLSFLCLLVCALKCVLCPPLLLDIGFTRYLWRLGRSNFCKNNLLLTFSLVLFRF